MEKKKKKPVNFTFKHKFTFKPKHDNIKDRNIGKTNNLLWNLEVES